MPKYKIIPLEMFRMWLLVSIIIKYNECARQSKNYVRSYSKCLNNILENYTSTEDIILWDPNDEIKLEVPITIQNGKEKFKTFQYNRRASCYVISLITNEDFTEVMQILIRSNKFDTGAMFIFIVDIITPGMLKVIYEKYIHKVIFITSIFSSIQYIHALGQYQKEDIDSPIEETAVVGNCTRGRLQQHNEFFENTSPMKWRNTTFRVSYLKIIPYTNCVNCPLLQKGIEAALMEVIKEKLNFKSLKYTETRSWGVKEGGNYTEALGEIKTGFTHCGIGVFHAMVGVNEDFDISAPLWEDGPKWVVPMSKSLPHWRKVVLLLKGNWYLILASLLSHFIATVVMTRVLQLNSRSLSQHLLDIVRVMLNNPQTSHYDNISLKMMLMILYYFSLIISCAYTSKLTSLTTVGTRYHQIDTLEEIIASKLTLGVIPDVVTYYSLSADPLEKRVSEKHMVCNLSSFCANRSAYQRDMAFTRSQEMMRFLIPKYFLDDLGCPLLHVTSSFILKTHVHWFFRRGFPMFEQINDLLLRLKASGVMNMYYSHLLSDAKMEYMMNDKKNRKHHIALGWEQLEFIFYVLFGGWMIGAISLSLELLLELLSRSHTI